jgi:catechol 2,3-dioxygenase-like lactoylglutathione lyase family enzyme
MTCDLVALCFDANDPRRLARFWGGVLGRQAADDGVTLLPDDDPGFRIRFLANPEEKTRPNRMHFDLTSSSWEEQQETVARALELGGRHLDIGQLPEEEHVVLSDPEGNEFCVVEPGNGFLAGCPRIGALSCDGPQRVGYFWSEALGWPLVWDQDEETAVRSPHGGSKISWGGPPVAPKVGRNRLRWDLTPTADGDREAEVARLVSLGATPVDVGEGAVDGALLADPDGNEFRVLAAAAAGR